MSSATTSVVTYTSTFPRLCARQSYWSVMRRILREAFLGVIILGSMHNPAIQPVAPPSPDYIPGLEDPQTPPIPQDEDEHEFLAEEQPLPPVDSPTAESPGHVTESDLEEDPEEYEDDETEDGPFDYPMDGEMMEMMMTEIHLGMTSNDEVRMMETRRTGEGEEH
ncbi:hypothetical protein Tco_1037049 [Tanacetum coccineum]